ncbi:testin isoform X1 [Bombus pascuorum]|uniref:testin isoform X1 n=1 Tax=Bombus pascuorum TaxID=65598 RepID=UPI002138A47B|nr:testin isoform X1 [Bombus pascuorum]
MNDTDVNDRPKWLLELENRKRKPRLAHEAGAGAPCVLCKAACPGLDLHFWRKICKNCKCSKDDHDVDDDDFPQFDLLFGTSRKYKKKSILLHINGGKEHAEEAFEWVPPDTTKELAVDYMKALPMEKLPIKGSPGAALRRQLLQKQLPLHDIDYKTCDKLSDQEKKQFERYLENIKKYVGQGTVTKILSARPFDGSLITPVNATDLQHHSPQNKLNVPPSFVHLRTPSSFAPKSSPKKNLYENLNVHNFSTPLDASNSSNIKNIPIFEKYTINKDDEINKSNIQDIAKDVPTTENLKYLNDAAVTNVNSEVTSLSTPSEYHKEVYKDVLKNPSTSLIHSKPINDNVDIVEALLADALLPPSTVHANDIVRSTLDEKGLMYIREKLTNKYSNQENQGHVPSNIPNFTRSSDSNNSLCRNTAFGLKNENIPSNKGADKTVTVSSVKYPGMLIPSKDKLQKAKKDIHNSGPIKTEMEIMKTNSNLVKSDPLYSTGFNIENLTESKSQTPSKVVENSFPSPASSSQTCPQIFDINNYQATVNSFTTPSTTLHSEKLENQIFPYETNSTAKQLEHHVPNITHLKSVMEELTIDSKSQKCHKCEEGFHVGDVAVITDKAKNAVWHPGCFMCSMCNELLVDLVYFYYKNKLYCGRDLATLLGIPRCFACDELIFVREYTVAEGHNYHVKHFCCWDCDVPLAGKQYITENDRPLCLLCYQKTYAKTCNMCEKVIAADQQGVAVKDLNFHATEACFRCYICNKNLLNGRFAVKEKKIFCSKECISNFLHPQIK